MDCVWLKSVDDISYPTFKNTYFKSPTAANRKGPHNCARYYFIGPTHQREWTLPPFITRTQCLGDEQNKTSLAC